MRGFWTFSLLFYSIIHTHDGAACVQHIVMVAILLLRTAMSALRILSVVTKGNIAGIVIYSLLAILSLWFTATCLAIIGDAAGDEQVNTVHVVGYIHYIFFTRGDQRDGRFPISLFLRPVLTTIFVRNAGTLMPSSVAV